MKLLVCDLDGTLYPKKDVANPHQFEDNINAVKRWMQKGNIFAVATARGLHHYPILNEELGFDVNFIGNNGAACRYINGDVKLKQMPTAIYIDLAKYIKENKINSTIAVGYKGTWLWSSKNCFPVGSDIYTQEFIDTIPIADLDTMDPNFGIERIQVFVEPNEQKEIKALIEARNYSAFVTTSDVYLIDIIPLNCSKGLSIMELCEMYNISQEDIIVAGDSENDIPMFKVANRSYCIDHASKHVADQATHIIKSVAEIIELELL